MGVAERTPNRRASEGGGGPTPPPPRRPAHHHRPAHQPRVVELLHRGVEGVQVRVQDGALHVTILAPCKRTGDKLRTPW